MKRTTVALALAAFAAGVGAPAALGTPGAAAPAHAPLPRAASCSGVWVVVDFGSLGGGVSTKCASSHGTGLGALRSAGFSPVVEDSFVYRISGKPSKPDINKAYWSYWQATKNADGSYANWKYSNVGAGSSHPRQGNAEGWKYVLLSAGNTPPGAKPPAAGAESPSPKPTKSATKSAPKPGKTTAKPTARPTARPTASASAGRSSPARATVSSTAASTATRTTAATPGASALPASTGPGDAGRPEATETGLAQEQPTATADAGNGTGSPVGAIVAGSVVVAGAAGLGGWWMMKGRKR